MKMTTIHRIYWGMVLVTKCILIFIDNWCLGTGSNWYKPGFSGVFAASTSVGAAVSSVETAVSSAVVVVVLLCTQKLGTNSIAFTFNVENLVDRSVSFSWAIVFMIENILKRVLYKKINYITNKLQ